MEMRWLRAFGDAIARRRRALKLSQEDVAYEAGISVRYFADVERGQRNASLMVARQIASALATPLQQLLDVADQADRAASRIIAQRRR